MPGGEAFVHREIVDEPDGWVLIKHRAFNSSTCYFGPFDTPDEASAWARENGIDGVMFVPVFKTVDWSR